MGMKDMEQQTVYPKDLKMYAPHKHEDFQRYFTCNCQNGFETKILRRWMERLAEAHTGHNCTKKNELAGCDGSHSNSSPRGTDAGLFRAKDQPRPQSSFQANLCYYI